eukprot:c709_g1_i1.p1 GENE.c709_g1_i1~~c709_g1_i1.p1  ORF type:complete len:207 (+),score=7.29 c709_g1_i1:1-621(+)
MGLISRFNYRRMFEKQVVIDGRGHLLGRLASIVAKELLNGQKVIIVRCEGVEISGSFYRNKTKYLSFLTKRCLVRPTHGPIHFRAPSKMVWRTIRGMMPHKTKRGMHALERLKVFEGVPPPYDKCKRMVIPDALKVKRLHPRRKSTNLGRLASEVGWKYADTVKTLEAKRKVQGEAYYARKKALLKIRTAAVTKVGKSDALAAFGY